MGSQLESDRHQHVHHRRHRAKRFAADQRRAEHSVAGRIQYLDSLRDAGLGGSGVINGIVDNYGYISPGNSPVHRTIIGSLTNSGDYYADLPPLEIPTISW